MGKCLNIGCGVYIYRKGAKYCSVQCREDFPETGIKINKYIKANSLEEFYRKFYVIYNLFNKKDLSKRFGVSINSLYRLKKMVFKYTTEEKVKEYWK